MFIAAWGNPQSPLLNDSPVIICTSVCKGTGVVNLKWVIIFIFCRCILELQLKIKMSCHHCYKFLLWYVHLIGQTPFVLPHVRKSGFPEIFAGGIRNPWLWNLDPGSHEGLESGIQVSLTKNPEFSTCISRIHSVQFRSQDCLGSPDIGCFVRWWEITRESMEIVRMSVFSLKNMTQLFSLTSVSQICLHLLKIVSNIKQL